MSIDEDGRPGLLAWLTGLVDRFTTCVPRHDPFDRSFSETEVFRSSTSRVSRGHVPRSLALLNVPLLQMNDKIDNFRSELLARLRH